MSDVALSRDDLRVATASLDETARLWDAASGRYLFCIYHAAAVLAVAFSRDAARLATGGADGRALIFDATNGVLQQALCGHGGAVTSCDFSRSAYVVTGSADGDVRLWSAARTRLERAVRAGAALTCVAFSRDRRRVATAGGPTDAEVHDVSTGRLAFALRGHKGRVAWVAYDARGDRLATASADRTARLWDAADGRALVQFRGHQDAVSCVALDAAGAHAATCGAEGTVLLFPARAAYRKLGPRAATPVVEAIRSLDNHVSSFRRLAFSPDGSALCVACADGKARILDAKKGAIRFVLEHDRAVDAVVFSHDGATIVTAAGRSPVLWDAALDAGRALDRRRTTLVGHAENVVAAAFSGDDARLATASHDGTGRLWDAASGELLLTFTGHADRVASVDVSADGARVATACHDGCARVWDATKPVFLKRWRGHGGAAVRCVSFSDHAENVVSGGRDRDARVWDPHAPPGSVFFSHPRRRD